MFNTILMYKVTMYDVLLMYKVTMYDVQRLMFIILPQKNSWRRRESMT